MASPVLGDKSTCSDCRKPITFVGRYWEHDGDWRPRHIAKPVDVGRPSADKTGAVAPTALDDLRLAVEKVKALPKADLHRLVAEHRPAACRTTDATLDLLPHLIEALSAPAVQVEWWCDARGYDVNALTEEQACEMRAALGLTSPGATRQPDVQHDPKLEGA